MQSDQRYSIAAIDRLLRPRSIAIVGASATPNALGASVLANLDRARLQWHRVSGKSKPGGNRRSVRASHRLTNCRNRWTAPFSPSRAPAFWTRFRPAPKRGVGAVIIFSAGFAEAGAEGRAEQERIRDISAEYGMIVEGPNCLGMVNYVEGVASHVRHDGTETPDRHRRNRDPVSKWRHGCCPGREPYSPGAGNLVLDLHRQ